MRLFDFSKRSGEPVIDWESTGVAALRITKDAIVPARASILHFERGAVLGSHPAGMPQLFVVTAGEGWVAGEDGVRTTITAGTAAFFDAGEEHASGSEPGMTAIVIQSGALDASELERE